MIKNTVFVISFFLILGLTGGCENGALKLSTYIISVTVIIAISALVYCVVYIKNRSKCVNTSSDREGGDNISGYFTESGYVGIMPDGTEMLFVNDSEYIETYRSITE